MVNQVLCFFYIQFCKAKTTYISILLKVSNHFFIFFFVDGGQFIISFLSLFSKSINFCNVSNVNIRSKIFGKCREYAPKCEYKAFLLLGNALIAQDQETYELISEFWIQFLLSLKRSQ